jgi:hypothetical protein
MMPDAPGLLLQLPLTLLAPRSCSRPVVPSRAPPAAGEKLEGCSAQPTGWPARLFHRGASGSCMLNSICITVSSDGREPFALRINLVTIPW